MAPPAPRLERVTAWMTASDLDALVVTGPALVTWITGYARYYGGGAGAVLSPARGRTLAVARGEGAVAGRMPGAEVVARYRAPGVGLALSPAPPLAAEGAPTGRASFAG